jgi:hypothetical protein
VLEAWKKVDQEKALQRFAEEVAGNSFSRILTAAVIEDCVELLRGACVKFIDKCVKLVPADSPRSFEPSRALKRKGEEADDLGRERSKQRVGDNCNPYPRRDPVAANILPEWKHRAAEVNHMHLIYIVEIMHAAITYQLVISTLCVDQKRAYNRVPPNYLLKILRDRKVPEWFIRLLASWFSGRTATIEVPGGSPYGPYPCSGVPQGSPLSSILFRSFPPVSSRSSRKIKMTVSFSE